MSQGSDRKPPAGAIDTADTLDARTSAVLAGLGHDPSLDDVMAAYIQARERGEAFSDDVWLACFPAMAEELAEFFASYGHMRRLTAPPEEPLAGGKRVGAYEVLEELGAGGMGVIYRARHVELEREVALKVIRAGRFATAEDRRRFALEAKAAARLSHPGIVPVYEVGELPGGHAYYSMKLMRGSLAQPGERWRSEPLAAAALLRDVARAIQHAHDHAILHRDLKPANILISDDGAPQVGDFGLAKILDAGSHATEVGAIVGTASYMAPEQASGDSHAATVATDIYGLGAVLYELITGVPPFRGATPIETLRQVCDSELSDPRQHNPRIGRDLAAVCTKCLEKDPARRYPSAAALAEDLARVCDGLPVSARPVGTLRRAWRMFVRKPERAALMAAAVAVVVAMALMASVQLGRARAAYRESRIRSQQILESNEYTAKLAAHGLRNWLERLSLPVLAIAGREELAPILRERAAMTLPAFLSAHRAALESILTAHAEAAQLTYTTPVYASFFLLDPDGHQIGRWPQDMPLVSETLGNRDYYLGARKLAEAGASSLIEDRIHISQVYKGVLDGLYKFAISTPVLDTSGDTPRLLGVVVASLPAGANLGMPEIQSPSRQAALLSRVDPEGGDGTAGWRVMLHSAYQPGAHPAAVDSALARELASRSSGSLAGYRDPVASAQHPDSAWLVGFARVPGTDFILLIQERSSDGTAELREYRRLRVLWLGGLAAALVVATGAVLIRRRGRR